MREQSSVMQCHCACAVDAVRLGLSGFRKVARPPKCWRGAGPMRKKGHRKEPRRTSSHGRAHGLCIVPQSPVARFIAPTCAFFQFGHKPACCDLKSAW